MRRIIIEGHRSYGINGFGRVGLMEILFLNNLVNFFAFVMSDFYGLFQ